MTVKDKDLVRAFGEGNKKVFDELVERYKKRIYFFALKMVQDHHQAEDIAQETFLRAYRSLHQFRSESSLLSWLLAIATNYYRSHKRKRHLTIVEDVNMEGIAASHISPDENNRQQQVKRAINCLPERQRLVLVLRTFEEMSYQEISQVVGISVSSVKANLSYARQALRKELME